MKELNFNIYALAAPKSPTEYIAVLDEAIRMANDLAEQIAADDVFLEMHAIAIAD
ncbi:MAG: hypothetical protein K9K35_02550 [Rhodoferax sp.]|nr:hypothetical protein [Rhodoferax sp.]